MTKKTDAKKKTKTPDHGLTNKQAFELSTFLESQSCLQIEYELSGFLKLEEIKEVLEPFAKKIKQIEINFLKSEEFDASAKERIEAIKDFVVCGADGEPVKNAVGGFTILDGKGDDVNAALAPTNQKHMVLEQKIAAQRQEWNEFFVYGIADVEFPLLEKEDLTLPKKQNGATWRALKSMAPSLFDKK